MSEEKKYSYQEYLENFYPNSARRQDEAREDLTPEEMGDKLAQETLRKMKEKIQETLARREVPV